MNLELVTSKEFCFKMENDIHMSGLTTPFGSNDSLMCISMSKIGVRYHNQEASKSSVIYKRMR